MRRPQLEALRQLKQYNDGVVLTSEWTNGRGMYCTRKAVPPFCERIERHRAYKYPQRIKRMFRLHPRAQAVIAIVNMRAANKALRE